MGARAKGVELRFADDDRAAVVAGSVGLMERVLQKDKSRLRVSVRGIASRCVFLTPGRAWRRLTGHESSIAVFAASNLQTPECRLRPLVYRIDKLIVELHRGDLAVASNDAGGTDVVSDRRRLAVTQK